MLFFFFKPKTAYEMRISDWSSDVCSSDLREGIFAVGHAPPLRLILLGHGAEMLTTLQLARSFGATVEIYSPDEQVVDAGLEHGIRSTRLISPTSPLMLEGDPRSEEHTSELQSLMRISYAVFCLKKKKK